MLLNTKICTALAVPVLLMAGAASTHAATITGTEDAANVLESYDATTASFTWITDDSFSTGFYVTSSTDFEVILDLYTPDDEDSTLVLESGATTLDALTITQALVGTSLFGVLSAGSYFVQLSELGQPLGNVTFSVATTAVPLPAGAVLLGSTLVGGLALRKRKAA